MLEKKLPKSIEEVEQLRQILKSQHEQETKDSGSNEKTS